jgi:hypothetical protein
MATFTPGLGEWFGSWAHPIYLHPGNVASARGTTPGIMAAVYASGNTNPGWVFVGWNHAYQPGVTYAAGVDVEYTYGGTGPGQTWRSLQNGNVGHQPGISPSWWQAVDVGLGADDANWIAIPGVQRPDRMNAGIIEQHFNNYHGAGVWAAMRWATPYSGGQWAGGGSCPAVRMSATEDTCYWSQVGDGEGWIYRRVLGVDTLIGHFYGTTYGTPFMWAHQGVVGVGSVDASFDGATAVPAFPTYLPHPLPLEVLGTVADTAIPESAGPYVGVRIAPNDSAHELYGGNYGFLTATAGAPSGGSVVLSGLRVPGSTITVTRR